MNNPTTTLLTLALLLLSLSFAPTASAREAPSTESAARDPCPPDNNGTYDKAYCTVQGIERATAHLGDELLAGNSTWSAADRWKDTVLACIEGDWKNCPMML